MEENKYFTFILKHKSKLLTGLACLFVIGVLADRNLSSRHSNAQRDLVGLSRSFETFLAGKPIANETLDHIEKTLKKHPSLHRKYDPLLARCLLYQENTIKGVPYASLTLERTKTFLPRPYQEFAKTSLLIAENKISEAFLAAEALHSKMEGKGEYETLYTFNLVRLLFLSRMTEKKEREKLAWEELQTTSLFPHVESFFQEGTVSLESFLSRS